MSRNNDYTTSNLLHYDYYSRHYKVITVDLSNKTELVENRGLKQQINLIGRLERGEGLTMFFLIEKAEETAFSF